MITNYQIIKTFPDGSKLVELYDKAGGVVDTWQLPLDRDVNAEILAWEQETADKARVPEQVGKVYEVVRPSME
ncbi:MAG: hypothetical protein HY689_00185 [Chloroflexi bacterium]|nr:hypothetical protein [Chloroflexota bacterium]